MNWACCQFRLDKIPKGCKESLRQQLQQVQKTTGITPPELKAEQPPDGLIYLFHYYREIRGTEPLTFTEIQNWSQLTQRDISAWEVSVIRALDINFWAQQNAD
ncbi:phage tail assembly chaperone [Microbulbifer sp. ANSA001]|uniref:phage tail assembly chaperone n=1 Tax=Microbulbifer sp. ANSA001 TaxID=3243358 RepID=UPI00404101D6